MSSWQWKDAAGRPLALCNEAAAEPFRGAGSSFGPGQNEAATGPFRGTRTKGLYGHSWHWKEAAGRSLSGAVQEHCAATAATGSKRQEGGQWHSDSATASSGRNASEPLRVPSVFGGHGSLETVQKDCAATAGTWKASWQCKDAAGRLLARTGTSFGSVQKDCMATAGTGRKRAKGYSWHWKEASKRPACTTTAGTRSGRGGEGKAPHQRWSRAARQGRRIFLWGCSAKFVRR